MEVIKEEKQHLGSMYALMVHLTSTTTLPDTTMQLPAKSQEFSDVFNKVRASKLPKHQPYDYPRDLMEGAQPPWEPIYSVSPSELDALQNLDEEETPSYLQDIHATPDFIDDAPIEERRVSQNSTPPFPTTAR